MKRAFPLLAATFVVLVPLADIAEAKDKGKGKFKHKAGGSHAGLSVKVKPGKVKVKVRGAGVYAHCPPGLAKKNPPCVPPGLARATPVFRDHDHDYGDYAYDGRQFIDRTYDRNTEYNEYELHEISQITTVNGDVIYVGDIIVNPTDRYPLLDPVVFGLPPLPNDQLYLRVGDAAVRLDADTQRVVTILALAGVLIE